MRAFSMAINEIWIPEALVVLFITLPLLRPFARILWPLDGLVWLPVVALAIMAGIFPAYGFRLECLPMLIFALVYNIANLPLLSFSARSQQNDSFLDQNKFIVMLKFVALAVVAIPMFAFSPRAYDGPEWEAGPVAVLKAGSNYTLRVFGDAQSGRPMIFLVPPEIGSSPSVGLICSQLYNKGFTVIAYSRKGYDFPNMLRYLRILNKASGLASANELGKNFEAGRRDDIEYLLPRLPALLGIAGQNELPPILLVGYGAGGSAIAYLCGENSFITNYGKVIGALAIEGQLWASYQNEGRAVRQITKSGKIHRYWTDFVNWFFGLMPQQVSRKGPLPHAGLPVLHLVSGRALEDGKRQKPYRAVFDSALLGPGPVALVAIESSGPLDYQDFPLTHPVLPFFRPGLKGAQKEGNPVKDTASIIGNFASLLLERTQTANGPDDGPDAKIPPLSPIGGRLYIESTHMPWLRL
jgi:hypothetical protein